MGKHKEGKKNCGVRATRGSICSTAKKHAYSSHHPIYCMGASPLPPSHQGQFGLSYQPQLGFRLGRATGLESGLVIPPVGREGRESDSQNTRDIQQQDTVPHFSPLLAASVAMSSLRKLFLMDNITAVSLPAHRFSLPWLWWASPVAGTHTHASWGPDAGLCAPSPGCCQSCFCTWCTAWLCSRVRVPPDLKGPGLERHCVGTVVGWVHQHIPLAPWRSHSASQLLPLDVVV